MMKKLFYIALLLISYFSYGQYNPTLHTMTNKAIGYGQATPPDARSMYYDATNAIYRDYQSTNECLGYLNLSKYRFGGFDIMLHSGGTLNSNGTYTGGVTLVYWFKGCTADTCLVQKINNGIGDTTALMRKANNLSDVTNSASARTNLGLGTMATQTISPGGDLSGNWPTITVSKFNGQPPSYYLNYGNLTNTPTIPQQLNPSAAGLMAITGTYPNLTFNAQTPTLQQTITQGNALSKIDTINAGGFPLYIQSTAALGLPTGTTVQRPSTPSTGYTRFNTDSVSIEVWNGSAWIKSGAGGGGGSGITALTGDVTASGTGSVSATLATVNTNTYASNTFLKFGVNGKGLVTSATPVLSSDITTALGTVGPNNSIVFNKGSTFVGHSFFTYDSLYANLNIGTNTISNTAALSYPKTATIVNGYGNNVGGHFSITSGDSNTTAYSGSGAYGFTFGKKNQNAGGLYVTMIGHDNYNYGSNNWIIGNYDSTSVGSNLIVGDSSKSYAGSTIGKGLVSNAFGLVVGQYNDTTGLAALASASRPSFIVGVGTGMTSRKNAFRVWSSGVVELPGYKNNVKKDSVLQTDVNGNVINGPRWIYDSVRFNKANINLTYDSLSAYGNSITVGMNASPSDSAYINRFNRFLAVPLVNHGLSGSGIWNAINQHNININPGHTAFSTVMAGFNDVRRNALAQKTYNKIINGYKAVFVNQFLKLYVAGGATDPSLSRYGTWTTSYNSASVGGKGGVTGAYSSTLNDSIVYTFTDTTVAVGLIGSDGITNIYSNFQVFIDGVSQGTFSENNQTDAVSDGVYDNARSPMVLYFTGLTNAAHKIKLVNTSATGTAFLVVDYFGTLVDKSKATPLLFIHAPKMNAAGYATAPANASDAIINSLNAALDSLVATFPSWAPVYVAKTENYYNITNGLSTDNIHPNNTGHRQIFNAITGAFNFQNGLLVYQSNNHFYAISNNFPLRIPFANEVVSGAGTISTIPLWNSVTQLGNSSLTESSTIINAAKNITVNNGSTIGDVSSAGNYMTEGRINATYPYLAFNYPSGAADTKINDFYSVGNHFYGRVVNDIQNTSTNWLDLSRTGMTLNSLTLPLPLITGNGVAAAISHRINTSPTDHIELYNFQGSNYLVSLSPNRDTGRYMAVAGKIVQFGIITNGNGSYGSFVESSRIDSSGNFLIGRQTNNGVGRLQIGGKITVDTLVNGNGSVDSAVVWNSVTHDFRKIAPGGGGTPTYFINSKLGDTTFRTTGPGLAANTIQWKGLIPGNGMNSVTTDSTIKYNWGGTLANATTINNNGFGITYSGTGTIAISGGNYNGSLGSTWQMNGATINNAVTAASGTVAKVAQASIGGSTWTASNTGVTYTNAATFYVDGPPTAGTNVTITNPYSLFINGGNAGLFHIRGTTGAPTVAVGTAGAGTVSCQNCTDIAGTVTFTMTSSVSFPTQASIFSVTFANPYLRAPNVVFSSNNIDAAFAAAYPYTKNVTTTGFSIAVQNAGTAAATTSSFTYHVIE